MFLPCCFIYGDYFISQHSLLLEDKFFKYRVRCYLKLLVFFLFMMMVFAIAHYRFNRLLFLILLGFYQLSLGFGGEQSEDTQVPETTGENTKEDSAESKKKSKLCSACFKQWEDKGRTGKVFCNHSNKARRLNGRIEGENNIVDDKKIDSASLEEIDPVFASYYRLVYEEYKGKELKLNHKPMSYDDYLKHAVNDLNKEVESNINHQNAGKPRGKVSAISRKKTRMGKKIPVVMGVSKKISSSRRQRILHAKKHLEGNDYEDNKIFEISIEGSFTSTLEENYGGLYEESECDEQDIYECEDLLLEDEVNSDFCNGLLGKLLNGICYEEILYGLNELTMIGRRVLDQYSSRIKVGCDESFAEVAESQVLSLNFDGFRVLGNSEDYIAYPEQELEQLKDKDLVVVIHDGFLLFSVVFQKYNKRLLREALEKGFMESKGVEANMEEAIFYSKLGVDSEEQLQEQCSFILGVFVGKKCRFVKLNRQDLFDTILKILNDYTFSGSYKITYDQGV